MNFHEQFFEIFPKFNNPFDINIQNTNIKIKIMIIRTSLAKLLTKKSIGFPLLTRNTPKFQYSEKDERFLRFIDFDAKYLSQVPWIFQPLKPFIHLVRDNILYVNSFIGLPWWVVILITSVFVRLTIFPLIFIQMKKMSRIGPIWPIFAHIKQSWRQSDLPLHRKLMLTLNLYRKLAHQQNFKMRSIFVYNFAYYPLLISMVYSLRSLLSVEHVSQSGFLWLNSLADIDPYFILPTLTIAAYYWNFERFITPQNKNTLISKVRSLCQVLLIIWYPFLCCWPSGIVLYMLCNAMMSILQSSIMKSMWFQSKINPKIMHYNYMLATAQYDKGTSDSIVQAIKTGEESLKEKAILQQVIVSQTEQMVKQLNKELKQESKQQLQQIDDKQMKNQLSKTPQDSDKRQQQNSAMSNKANPYLSKKPKHTSPQKKQSKVKK